MLAQQVLNGLILGAVYGLTALSYSVVMGVFGVLNIAVAGLFLLGGYLGFELLTDGHSIWLAILVALAAAGLGGVIVELVAYRPLAGRGVVMPLLSTLGLAIVVQTFVINTWGSDPFQLTSPPLTGRMEVAGVAISAIQLLILGVTVVLFVGMGLLMNYTWTGRSIRAVAENPRVTTLLGVPARRVTITTFAISGVLAGAAGFLIGLNYQVLTASSGLEVGLKGIAVMVVGGARNIWGGLIAGPLLGISEVLVIAYGSSEYRDMVVWGFLILILLLRPQGLVGRESAVEQRA